MNVLIVDDEPPARERLAGLLAELDGWSVAGEARNGREALDFCARQRPDVVLMDIRMPGMDGVEAARHLSMLDEPPAVIFTTAYDEYAIEAFEAQAIGYLLKPVRRPRLERALAHAVRLTRPQLARMDARTANVAPRGHVCVRVRDELKLIPVRDVLCFVADQKYVTVRHKGGEDLLDESLKDLEREFAAEFLRIHRNALIALRHLDAVEKTADGSCFARIRGCDERLVVSRRQAGELRRRLRGR
ncbi:MAG TPA: LytTR family DNA-binding domain-containing protein [Gammaproteobacteria bacterium]|nr:LytTR family DNA-binding domain-containing protein [Gammaproteobacteria bacterium]